MSFWNLVEAFVLKGLREEHRMSFQRIRVATGELRRLYPELSHPLAQLDLAVLNRDLYSDRDGALVDASRGGQLGIRGVLELYLSRVEKGEGGAIRLYLFTRPKLAAAPQFVAIDPTVSFGRPVIAGTSIPTAVLHEPGRPATRLLAGGGLRSSGRENRGSAPLRSGVSRNTSSSSTLRWDARSDDGSRPKVSASRCATIISHRARRTRSGWRPLEAEAGSC
jgi:hypothetical protein